MCLRGVDIVTCCTQIPPTTRIGRKQSPSGCLCFERENCFVALFCLTFLCHTSRVLFFGGHNLRVCFALPLLCGECCLIFFFCLTSLIVCSFLVSYLLLACTRTAAFSKDRKPTGAQQSCSARTFHEEGSKVISTVVTRQRAN